LTDAEFQVLVDRARGGDSASIERLLEAFEGDVRAMVRARLPRSLRPRFDSMDFVQEVWRSLLERPIGDGPGYDDAARFRGYLAGVVRNKVLEEFRRRTRCQKNDLAREESLYVENGGRAEPRAVIAPGSTPSEEMQARDCLDRLVAGGNPIEAQIVELRRQALTFEEIAGRLGIHERSVRRMVDALKARWPGASPLP
jgi:RNA polymerase sigma-70 factor (ECF subfamily)